MSNTLDSLPDLLTITQVCEYLDISKPTLYDDMKRGLKAIKVGRRVRIRKTDLIVFLNEHPWIAAQQPAKEN